MTHPFHPLNGQEFVCVGERYGSLGRCLLLEIKPGVVRGIRPYMTDAVAVAAEVVVSGGRSHFLIDDLLRLADMLAGRETDSTVRGVTRITPQV